MRYLRGGRSTPPSFHGAAEGRPRSTLKKGHRSRLWFPHLRTSTNCSPCRSNGAVYQLPGNILTLRSSQYGWWRRFSHHMLCGWLLRKKRKLMPAGVFGTTAFRKKTCLSFFSCFCRPNPRRVGRARGNKHMVKPPIIRGISTERSRVYPATSVSQVPLMDHRIPQSQSMAQRSHSTKPSRL